MPKIIENLQSRLMEEVRRQIEEGGYSAMTIRSVAQKCGVGVGTVYNYYPSKDALLAAYLLSDWSQCVFAINAVSTYSDTPTPVLKCIYDQLCGFARRHAAIFRDDAAASAFAGSFSRYHGLLRSQLASPLRKFCESDFMSEFIAEALLSWTMAGKDFQEIYGMIHKLF
jgi:AcrR family transcriptional regulator